MRRRDVIALLGIAATWPLGAGAQPSKRPRQIGLMMAYDEGDLEGQERLAAFRQSLGESGWIDGQNAMVTVRWLAGNPDRAANYAKELVAQSPDVLVVNGSPGLTAVQRLTKDIPVVFVVVTDPVGAGFIPSLSRPGGNVTGFSTFEPEIGGKWVEALVEAAPNIKRLGVLMDPDFRGFSALWREIESIAPSFHLQAFPVHGRDGEEIESALVRFGQQTNGGLIVLPTPANAVARKRIFSLTARHRLPAIYPFSYYAQQGGLLAYGFHSIDLFRRAGPYVARILNGEQPGSLAVQAPTKFELVINLNTAKALGLSIPPTLLARADEVIE
jgi:putative ABC transport system substrate-binding protein